MNNTKLERHPTATLDLTQVIEPLASYICAAECPRETMFSALTALFIEVRETNAAARLHAASLRSGSLGMVS
jgi:hypothetical protein